MRTESCDVLWLHRSQPVSIGDLVALSGFSELEVHELVDYGALAPLNAGGIPWMFSANSLVTVRKVGRLRDDLELDEHALALVIMLLEQIQVLEAEFSRLRAQRPTFTRY